MNEKDLAVGDIVLLTSGGPAMAVREIRDGSAKCNWFAVGWDEGKSEEDILREGEFPIVCLVRVGRAR
jgi:uncharacterized protein YodC (DUF2158 family)